MLKDIICCGNIAFDLIATGESTTSQARPGGSVLNTAILLARLGLSVSMLAKTGEDLLGASLLKTMRDEKIKTGSVVKDKNIKTGLAIARINEKGDSSYIFYKTKGPQVAFKKKEVPLSLFKKARFFHTGSAYTYSDFSFEDALRLIKLAKQENCFTSYDPNWRDKRIKNKKKARARIKKILPYVDLLKLSDIDAMGITGVRTLSAALRRIPPDTFVTLGDKGSFYWDGNEKTVCPAFRVSVVDTIGAGDGFTAGLIYRYYLKGKIAFGEEKKETLVFASAVAALVCRGRGAAEGLRNLRQVTNFLKATR